jgi:tryptophan-rich sensory protein
MSPFIKHLILFFILNFGALAIGGFLMGEGPGGEWYQSLNQAPWTPPGWVFGAAWTTIMVCFSFYMAYLLKVDLSQKVILLFALQWILNVGWNPVFFDFHQMLFGLIIIVALTILVGYFLFTYKTALGAKTWLIAPYFIWLCIATSLNAFALLNN